MDNKNVSLTKRENQVLHALVRAHVNSRSPIGSNTLSEEYELGVSPATIRATLSALEEKDVYSNRILLQEEYQLNEDIVTT